MRRDDSTCMVQPQPNDAMHCNLYGLSIGLGIGMLYVFLAVEALFAPEPRLSVVMVYHLH
jgi:hypothetical protein